MKPRMADVLAAVAQCFRMEPGELRERTNRPEVVRPRHVAIWLMHRRGGFSLPQIGAFFRLHHTTVWHGVAKIDAMIEDDEISHVKQVVDKLWVKG